jgi:transposase
VPAAASPPTAAVLLGQACPTGAAAITYWQLAIDLIADIRDLDRRIAAVNKRIKAAVDQSRASLVELFGVGRPGAGCQAAWRGRRRASVRSKHHLAAHTGTAPLEASSGQVVRHRLSRAGDRKLNHALYMMAIVQIRHSTAGQAYYRRKLAEGKSPKEALRCLKRRLSDAVNRCLVTDQQRDAAARQLAGGMRVHPAGRRSVTTGWHTPFL